MQQKKPSKDDNIGKDVENKSCIIRRNEKESDKLTGEIEEKIKKLNNFVDQTDQ